MGLLGDTVYPEIKMHSSAICVALLLLKMHLKEGKKEKRKRQK